MNELDDLTLVAYATRHGSTQQVARAIAERLHARGVHVELLPAADVRSLERYGAVVLGSALYMGHWHADARRFMRRHRAGLATVPVALFAMGALKDDESDRLTSRGQLERSLSHFPEIVPVDIAIFGGALDPAAHHFPFNRMPASDTRDWEAIERWSDELVDLLDPAREGGASVLAPARGAIERGDDHHAYSR